MKRMLLAALLLSSASLAEVPAKAAPEPVLLPGGGAGIGFDDLGFAASLKKVLVPGGRTGKIFLVDPNSRTVSSVGGFTAEGHYKGGHAEGVTSADASRGLLFGADRNSARAAAVDPKSGKVVASVKLSGGPDYVRYVASRKELWVTEPSSEKIEVFTVGGANERFKITKTADISIPGGPESLVIDDARGRAYTHTWKSESLAIGLKSRAVEERWPNGCKSSRGIALDSRRGFLFVGCDEGKAVVLDAAHGGKILSSFKAGRGVDVIAYSEKTRHLYLPGAASETLAVLGVSRAGTLKLVEEVKTAKGAHCVAADERGGFWVCDPDRGRLLFFKNPDETGE